MWLTGTASSSTVASPCNFLDRNLVDALVGGWDLQEVHAFEEGELPRRLWRVTQSLPR